jgi:cell division protein FtsB
MSAATSLTAYKRREKQKQYAKHIFVGLLFLLVLSIVLLFVWRAYVINTMQQELEMLKTQKIEAEAEKKTLENLLAQQNDLRLIEYLARTELGLVKKGEIKFKVCVEGSPSSQGFCTESGPK